MAAMGLIPVGSYKNREYYLPGVVNRDQVAPELVDIIADPQTSGGLLIAVPPEQGPKLLEELAARNVEGFVVGRVVGEFAGKIRVD
jgi:selenide,water dikinase